MHCIRNERIAVFCGENGRGLAVLDITRGTRWSLDEKTLVYRRKGMEEDRPLRPVEAAAESGDRLTVVLDAGDSLVSLHYILREDHVEIRMPVPENEQLVRLAFPGSFRPGGEGLKLLLPIMQGMLWDGRGPALEEYRGEAGHQGFSMPFIGYLGGSGGLLFTAETQDDLNWWFGKDEAGRIWAANLQTESLGTMGYERVGRLYVTGPGITAVAKTYRSKVIRQGRFRSWEDKIAERPALERIFGSLMCFVGYCRDDLDYAAECKKLKDYGFDRALVYPGRFNTYDRDVRMGGEPMISLGRDQVEAIKSLGYEAAPWSWINEAIDDGTDAIRHTYRLDGSGNAGNSWTIDDHRWYRVCTTFMEEVQQRALASDIADMSWDHFDVLTCATNGECHALNHAGHPGFPLSRTEDREWIRKVLRAGHAVGRIISSENFNDAYSTDYDIGSVKAWPQGGNWPFWPVPLTMLVYHDSMVHSWWELHSYNNPWRCMTRWSRYFEYGGGRPRLMAAADALMGCPPDVFPFGAQYGYTGNGRESYLFKYRFEDPEVQIALKEALPVARLHRKIGKLEMVDFRFLSPDGHVQETVFSDGTRVAANFSRDVYYSSELEAEDAEQIGSLMPESWKIVQAQGIEDDWGRNGI